MRARPHYQWRVAPEQPVLAQHLSREMGISQLLAQCLLNRGLSEIEAIAQFLDPRLKHLADPFLLPEMTAAVDRLFAARETGESLVIFGDYDVDGVTATALLTESLNALGWRASYYLPHRIEEGYGLSQAGVELPPATCGDAVPRRRLRVDSGRASRIPQGPQHRRDRAGSSSGLRSAARHRGAGQSTASEGTREVVQGTMLRWRRVQTPARTREAWPRSRLAGICRI
jgi:hypothetical protein